jgi:hypothetical protein
LAVGSTTDKIMFSKILVKSKGGGGDHRQLLVQQRGSPEHFLKSQKLHQSETSCRKNFSINN